MRLFLAVELPDSLKKELGQKLRHALVGKSTLKHLKQVQPKNLHITLRFLGEQNQDTSDKIIRALQAIQLQPFSVIAQELDFFTDKSGRVRVLFSKVNSEPLQELSQAVNQVLDDLGFPKDKKPLIPHITLARFKRPIKKDDLSHLMNAFHNFREEFKVINFTLFKSELQPSGPIYHRIKVFDLFPQSY